MHLSNNRIFKNTRFQWLSRVPADWGIVPLKRIATLQTKKANTKQFNVGLEHIQSHTSKFIDAETDFSGEGVAFRRNDILFGKLRPYLAKIWLADRQGEAVGEFFVLRVKEEFDPAYLKYHLLARDVIAAIDGSTYGAKMPRAGWDFVSMLAVCTPPIEEQQCIARYLDREIAKIDLLISKQIRLIELLREKRKSVITEAITKGLDPNVKMKDSGVPWLGQVPANWTLKRLKHLGSAQIGLTYSPEDVVSDEEHGTLVLRSSNVQQGALCYEDNVYVRTRVPAKLYIRNNDILICSRNGSRALIGKCALVDSEAASARYSFGAFMTVFRSDLNPYLYWYFSSSLFESQSGSFLTSTINQLTTSNLYSMVIPMPSKKEVEELLEYLIDSVGKIDKLISKQARLIELLRERRAGLIQEVVTGKLDVRGLA